MIDPATAPRTVLPRLAPISDGRALRVCDGRLAQARWRPGAAIYDRIGGGDWFASGLIHGALAMTTPGQTAMATLAEVERVMPGATPRAERSP